MKVEGRKSGSKKLAPAAPAAVKKDRERREHPNAMRRQRPVHEPLKVHDASMRVSVDGKKEKETKVIVDEGLQHTHRVVVKGYVRYVSKWWRTKKIIYLYLHGTALRCYEKHTSPVSQPLWTMDVTGVTEDRNHLQFTVHGDKKDRKIQVSPATDLRTWVDALRRVSKMYVENFYHAGDRLGVGGFSVVTFGTEKATGRTVAIKRMTPESNKRRQVLAEREVALVRTLKHENIVETLDAFEHRESFSIVMEYAPGGTLLQLLRSRPGKRIGEEEAKEILRPILTTLAYMHARGVAHRDIKPGNVLLMQRSSPFQAKLCDFGLSRVLEGADGSNTAKETRTSLQSWELSRCGTTAYAAPEMLLLQSYSVSVDMWSMGAVLFRMLTGWDFFRSKNLIDALDDVKAAEAYLQRWFAEEEEEEEEVAKGKPEAAAKPPDPQHQIATESSSSHLSLRSMFHGFGLEGFSRLVGGDIFAMAAPAERPHEAEQRSSAASHIVSPQARDFLRRLLQRNEEERMRPEEALKHPWLQQQQEEKEASEIATTH